MDTVDTVYRYLCNRQGQACILRFAFSVALNLFPRAGRVMNLFSPALRRTCRRKSIEKRVLRLLTILPNRQIPVQVQRTAQPTRFIRRRSSLVAFHFTQVVRSSERSSFTHITPIVFSLSSLSPSLHNTLSLHSTINQYILSP